MQFSSDTDLAEALASPSVQIRPLLEFDWNRDGLYAHAYSNMTLLLQSIDIDGATFTSDLPEEVNAAIGSSSGQATIVLAGRRAAEELTAAQLFNQYYAGTSPLVGFRRQGTPVRYSRRVRTSTGYSLVRQFTGWIAEPPSIDEATGTVTLVCSDVYDLQTAIVTLPHWGVGPGPEQASQAVGGLYSYLYPIEMTWLYDHLLLAAGRSRGPSTKDDTVAYWSCSGSFLPSVGSIMDTVYSQHAISYENAPDAWVSGINNALAPKATTYSGNSTLNYNRCRTPGANTVPRNGQSGDAAKWTEISFWAYSVGPDATSMTQASFCGLMLDSASSGITPGQFTAYVNLSGRLRMLIAESTNISGARTWEWLYDVGQAEGWHYYSVVIFWSYATISATLTVDDVNASWTTTTLPAPVGGFYGFRYQQMLQSYEFGNVAYINPKRATVQFVQIRHRDTAIIYDAAQKYGAMRDGWLLGQFDRSALQLTYIPDRTNKVVWDLFKEIVNAELGRVWTDEYGSLHFKPREYIYFADAADRDNATRLDRGKLGPLKITPTANTYRNAVSMTTTYSAQIRGTVWQASDPKGRYTENGAFSQETVYFDDSVVSVYFGATIISFVPPATGVPLTQNDVANCRADLVGLEPASGVGVNVIPSYDQRTAINLWSNSSGNPVYVGSYQEANQAAWFINGTKLMDKANGKFLYTDGAEVADVGVQLIEIQPSEWLQGEAQAQVISQTLLADLANPAPLLDPVVMAPDPRRQLGDFVLVSGGSSMTGDLLCQIIGIRRRDEVSDGETEFKDVVTLRVALTPGIMRWDVAGVGWDAGTWDD